MRKCRHDELLDSSDSAQADSPIRFARRGHIREDCRSSCPKLDDSSTRRASFAPQIHHRVAPGHRVRRATGEGMEADRSTRQPQYGDAESRRATNHERPARIGQSRTGDHRTRLMSKQRDGGSIRTWRKRERECYRNAHGDILARSGPPPNMSESGSIYGSRCDMGRSELLASETRSVESIYIEAGFTWMMEPADVSPQSP